MLECKFSHGDGKEIKESHPPRLSESAAGRELNTIDTLSSRAANKAASEEVAELGLEILPYD
jgi:hypothetical protein